MRFADFAQPFRRVDRRTIPSQSSGRCFRLQADAGFWCTKVQTQSRSKHSIRCKVFFYGVNYAAAPGCRCTPKRDPVAIRGYPKRFILCSNSCRRRGGCIGACNAPERRTADRAVPVRDRKAPIYGGEAHMYAVIGITGKVGCAVVRTLLAAGRPVRDADRARSWAERGCEAVTANTSRRGKV
jgi:hypothetical protein